MNDLTIIIPTYNRNKLFERCLLSAISIFKDKVNYIIGNSGIDNIKNIITSKFYNYNILYLNLSKYECNMYMIYKNLLDKVTTKYVLILEDDDMLVNQQFHLNILKQIHQYDFITFASTDNKNSYMTNIFYTDDWQNIPILWNGEYQFGMSYFKTQLLKEAFNIWFINELNKFVYSSDEALALIIASKTKKIKHFNEIGLVIGIQNDNLSWNNLPFSLYSTYSYINDIQKILNIRKDVIKKYKNIQLIELQTMTNKKLSYSIYTNKYVKYIQENVRQKILKYKNAKEIKSYIYNMISLYLINFLKLK